MHRVSDVVALRTAAGIYAFVVLSLVVSAAFIDRSAFMPSQEEALANASEQTQLLLGGPAEIVQHHLGGLDLLVIQAASLQRSEEHTSELQSRGHLVCRLLLEKKKI